MYFLTHGLFQRILFGCFVYFCTLLDKDSIASYNSSTSFTAIPRHVPYNAVTITAN